MKKITTILLTLLLGFAMAGCTTQDDAGTPEDIVNPTNLTFSLHHPRPKHHHRKEW